MKIEKQGPVVDIVIPVYNEEVQLEPSVHGPAPVSFTEFPL